MGVWRQELQTAIQQALRPSGLAVSVPAPYQYLSPFRPHLLGMRVVGGDGKDLAGLYVFD